MARHDRLGRVRWELSRPGRLRSRQRGFDGDMYDKLVQRLVLRKSAFFMGRSRGCYLHT